MIHRLQVIPAVLLHPFVNMRVIRTLVGCMKTSWARLKLMFPAHRGVVQLLLIPPFNCRVCVAEKSPAQVICAVVDVEQRCPMIAWAEASLDFVEVSLQCPLFAFDRPSVLAKIIGMAALLLFVGGKKNERKRKRSADLPSNVIGELWPAHICIRRFWADPSSAGEDLGTPQDVGS